MSSIFVAGLINIETTLKIDAFPFEYVSARFPFNGVNSSVSGVGYNISKALTSLGDTVSFASIIGTDDAGYMVRRALLRDGITDTLVLSLLAKTAQSVILYDQDGKRAINTDLKDIQESVYPLQSVNFQINACDLAVICNINFARPMLDVAMKANKWIATDVHAIADLNDPYNQDYMNAAHILFMSNDALSDSPEETAKQALDRFGNEMVIIGLGGEGALLALKDGRIEVFPAVHTRPVINTIGAGDALFSCFVHEFSKDQNPVKALRRATVFASYKIGEVGAADGFLNKEDLDKWVSRIIQE